MVGVPFYGQSYTLKKDKEHGLGADTDGPGLPGEYTQQPGMLAYYEICYRIKTRKWAVQRDSKLLEPFTYQGDQWVSYEDATSLTEKVSGANNLFQHSVKAPFVKKVKCLSLKN